MVWFTLALFAVSFLLTALLAPKPEFEDARAEDLDPNNFPRATEDAPIPLLFGCAKIKGPNTLWYGDYRAVPISKKVKTGLFSSTRVVTGHEYFLSIDLGLCLGDNVQLKKIFIDSEEVEDGSALFTGGNEFVRSVGGLNDPSPVQYSNILPTADGEWDTRPGDDDLMIDLLDIFPSMAEVNQAWANGELDFVMRVDGYWEDDPILGGDPGLVNKAWGIAIFNDDGTGNPDLANPRIGRATTALDTGNYDREFRFGGLFPVGNWQDARFIRGRYIGYPFNQTNYFQNVEPGTGLGTGRQTLTAEHQFNDQVSSQIFAPELYGGRENGGGHVGNYTFYTGSFTQNQDPTVQASVGTNDIPAYRGVCHIVLENNLIGERPALSQMEFLLNRYTNRIGGTFGGRIASGADDADLAEVAYDMCVNEWAGLDIDPSKFNIASFQAASTTLISEGNGGSGVVSSPRQGKNVLREILRQIDGVLAEDSNGQVNLRLIRNDYDVASLPVYGIDQIVEIPSFSRTAYEDVVTEVKVKFESRTKESSRVALAQNDATLNMIGTRRTTEISFPFCYDETLANQLAARELARLSIPLVKMTAIMDRSGYQLIVGDVIKVTFPELGLDELVVRVQKVDAGELEDNRVEVELVQDIYAISTTVFAAPENTGWVDDRPEPVTVPSVSVVEQPFFYASRLDTPAEDGFAAVVPFPVRPQEGSSGFTFNVDDETGVLEFFDPEDVAYPVTGQLQAEYDRLTGFQTGLDSTGFTIGNMVGTPLSALTAEVRTGEAGILYVNGEWMAYETVLDNMDGTFTLSNIYRGLFGTRPLTHAASTQVFVLTNELLGLGTLSGELTETGTAFYKVLDRVGGTQRSAISETEASQAMADLADRPLRPRLMQIDGSRSTVPHDAAGTPSFSLTWVNSNRASGEVTFENDATQVPDQVEEYDLEVWVDGVQDVGLSQSNVVSPLAVDLSSASGATGELRLYSRRAGGDTKTSAYYAFYPVVFGISTDTTTITADDTTITADQT
ncbi:MAG: phage tail protein [Cyanobacteria bacterium J06638_20]